MLFLVSINYTINTRQKKRFNMLYNEEELCDEEKSYHEWVANNLEFMQQNKNHIGVMKKLYISGFAAGFLHKQKITAQEYLQK